MFEAKLTGVSCLDFFSTEAFCLETSGFPVVQDLILDSEKILFGNSGFQTEKSEFQTFKFSIGKWNFRLKSLNFRLFILSLYK